MAGIIVANSAIGATEATENTEGRKDWQLATGYCSYTGTGTFSTISRSTWSDCSDFLRVEA
jgi:hypothetical protein